VHGIEYHVHPLVPLPSFWHLPGVLGGEILLALEVWSVVFSSFNCNCWWWDYGLARGDVYLVQALALESKGNKDPPMDGSNGRKGVAALHISTSPSGWGMV